MPTDTHSSQTVADGIHIAQKYTVANTAARDALSSPPVGSIVEQTDTLQFWIVTATTPTFKEISADEADKITFTADGDIAATDVQAAIVEVRDDTDTKLSTKVTGPGTVTDNIVPRYDSTTGYLLQDSGVSIDDSDNVTGVANIEATGYIELTDMSAPSNPSDGEGRLYKKTSDDGLFWLPNSGGSEVDLSAAANAQWLAELTYRVNTSSSNWVNMDKTRYFDTTWANTSSAQSGTPVFSQNDSGWTIPYDCTVTDVIITFQPAVSSATAAMRFGLYRSRPNYGSTDVPSVGVVVAGTDMTHTTLSSTYLVSVGNGLTLGAGVDLDQHDQLIPVGGSNGTSNDCYGTFLVKIEAR